jgi:hypothetical protein
MTKYQRNVIAAADVPAIEGPTTESQVRPRRRLRFNLVEGPVGDPDIHPTFYLAVWMQSR